MSITGEMRFVQLAGEKINQGRKKEEAKDWQGAKSEYIQAIECFKAASDGTKIPESRKVYQQKIVELLNRGEQIMKIIENQAAAARVPVADGGGGGNKDKKNDDQELKDSLAGAIIAEKPNVKWSDVAGLEIAKQSLREAVVLPLQFPELFTEKRKPWKGILLYGPPGTGKSFLAKAVATEVNSTFLSVSSSDIMSKWVGQSEKLVKQLFVLAREKRPSIVFIDEIDSMAGKRGDNETEGARRVKTELLVQMEGVGADNDKILFLGATNTPWDLDSAVRRRFEKRIYIPLPDAVGREAMFKINLGNTPNMINPQGFHYLAENSNGYSGADISIIVRDALMQPIRRLQNAKHFKQISVPDPKTGIPSIKYTSCDPNDPQGRAMSLMDIQSGQLYTPPVTIEDLMSSLSSTRPSVSKDDVQRHVEWTKEFGRES